MKLKFFNWLLIYCLIIEPSLLNMGCTSFYTAEKGNDLNEYLNDNALIIVKLKDESKIKVKTNNIFYLKKGSEFIFGEGKKFDYLEKKSLYFKDYIPAEDIKSEEIRSDNSTSIHLFRMKDSTKILIQTEELFRIRPDKNNDSWVLYAEVENKFHKISTSDIAGVEIEKFDWVLTSIVITLSLGLILFLLLSGKDKSTGSGDCSGSIPSMRTGGGGCSGVNM